MWCERDSEIAVSPVEEMGTDGWCYVSELPVTQIIHYSDAVHFKTTVKV